MYSRFFHGFVSKAGQKIIGGAMTNIENWIGIITFSALAGGVCGGVCVGMYGAYRGVEEKYVSPRFRN